MQSWRARPLDEVYTVICTDANTDVFFVVCDGLKGLPEVAGNAWPQAIVQAGAVHHADLPSTPVWRRELLVAGA